jgi:hypothetical protein
LGSHHAFLPLFDAPDLFDRESLQIFFDRVGQPIFAVCDETYSPEQIGERSAAPEFDQQHRAQLSSRWDTADTLLAASLAARTRFSAHSGKQSDRAVNFAKKVTGKYGLG